MTVAEDICAITNEPIVSLSYDYKIPHEYGGGGLCRSNWSWLYGISAHKMKGFAEILKKSLMKEKNHSILEQFDVKKTKTNKYTDKTYLGTPYYKVKAIFEEIKISG